MSTIKISYAIEGLSNINSTIPDVVTAEVLYHVPVAALDAAHDDFNEAIRAFLSHPGVAKAVEAFSTASVEMTSNIQPKQKLPVGRKIKQLFRLAQAKLGV